MVLGFEPTTFRTWVSSHNHSTRAPAEEVLVTVVIEHNHVKALVKLIGAFEKLFRRRLSKNEELQFFFSLVKFDR